MQIAFKSITLIALMLLYPLYPLIAQPNRAWLRMIDEGGSELFSDIYNCNNGGYALCGRKGDRDGNAASNDIWIASLSEDGEIIWSRTFGGQNESDEAYSIIEADNGDFVVGGIANGQLTALRMADDGELVWIRSYGNRNCNAIIELKNGNFLLAGRSGAGTRSRLICINGDGNQLWEHSYGVGDNRLNEFWGIRETDGGAVIAGQGWNEIREQSEFWAVKVSLGDEGAQIWSQYYPIDVYGSCRGIVSSGDGGFALAGTVSGGQVDRTTDFALLRINAQGEEIWHQRYHFGENNFVEYCNGLVLLDDGGYVLAGNQWPSDRFRPAAMRVRSDGTIRWQQLYEFREGDGFGQGRAANHNFRSVIRDHTNSILAAGNVYYVLDESLLNGLIVKLEPEPMGIGFISYSPQDTLFSILRDDTVNFAVIVRNFDERQLDFIWSKDGEQLDSDTTDIQLIFSDFGRADVQCEAISEELGISVTWHVTVTDLYVSAFTPDTLDLAIRRGSSVDFSLDTIRYTPGNEPEILWTKTNLSDGQAEDAGTESRATIDFPWSGEYSVEGRVSRGESSDAVTWHVDVKGAIWAYVPVADSLEVLPDSIVHFEVVPSAPEDESLEVSWLVDGELVREGELALDWAFSTVDNCRRYLVQVVVADSVEADTVQWVVTVNDLSVGDSKEVRQAGTPVLLSVSPNPFNSMLTIRYATSGLETAVTRLAIYDVAGRQVANLHGSTGVTAGRGFHPATEGGATEHQITWDASDQSAGVYIVHLQAGRDDVTKKIVLLR